MSHGPVGSSVPTKVGNHERRLRVLERRQTHSGGGGDYVFLDEQIVAADGDPLVISDISQAYRHLVLEASLATAVTSAHGVTLAIEKQGGGSWGFAASHVVGSALIVYHDTSVSGVHLTSMLPGKDDSADVAKEFLTLSAKIPYYSLTDRVKGMVWQATAIVDEVPIFESGGGVTMYQGDDPEDNDPVTEITLFISGGLDWAAGSVASIYGIR